MMEKDKELEELFGNFNPELKDNRVFMIQLTKKLDSVEYVKRVQEAHIRRYRLFVVAAFACGVICGAVLFAMVLFAPAETELFHIDTDFQPLMFIEQNSRTLSLIVLSLIMSTGIFAILKNFNEQKSLMEYLEIRK